MIPVAQLDSTPLLTVSLLDEADVVTARQRARQLSAELGFPTQDQVRIATAVSEIARNAYQYAQGGKVEFGLALNDMVKSGKLKAPIVMGRDHLDCGSVASPFRETEAKHPVEIVGKQLRAAMPFLDPVTVEEVAKSR